MGSGVDLDRGVAAAMPKGEQANRGTNGVGTGPFWMFLVVVHLVIGFVAVVMEAWPFAAVLLPLAVVAFVLGVKSRLPGVSAVDGLASELGAADAERAARQIVQHELSSPWNWPGVMPFVMITIAMLVWLSRAGFTLGEEVNETVWSGVAFAWIPVWALALKRRGMLAKAGTRGVLAELSAASVRRTMVQVNDRLRMTAFLFVTICSLAIAASWPGSSPFGAGGEAFQRVLPVWAGLIAAVLVLVANVVTTRGGASDEEVEDHRRKVLGEDWFVG